MARPLAHLVTGVIWSLLLAAAAPAATREGSPVPSSPPDVLEQGFRDPPMSARPRVWWHWMNGNVTIDGIDKDLDWMKRVGIGGLQNFDANLTTPQIVDHRLIYMTPEWKAAFRHAAQRAEQLGLELGIAASPGWSETGGPWVQPRDGLKKLVWSDTIVEGGHPFSGRLPAPPSVTGPFQNLPMAPSIEEMLGVARPAPKPVYYADVAVLAFPVADAETLPPPAAASGAGTPLDAAALTDDDLNTIVTADPGTPEHPGVLTLTYDRPRTIRSATLFVPGAKSMFASAAMKPQLEARGADGAWHAVGAFELREVPTTIGFAPVTGQTFRLVLTPAPGSSLTMGDAAPGAIAPDFFSAVASSVAPKGVPIAQLRLSPDERIDDFEAKAGFAIVPDYYALDAAGPAEGDGVAPASVLDLTGRMRPDGTLDWTPPKGRWKIVRLGYSLLGTTNHPATPEATGLEVDKFDGAAVREYLETYLGMYRDTVGPDLIGAHGVRALVTDSIEVGAANWTPRMVERFKALRGYDPTLWLPALTGAVVGSRARSDSFLYDFRRTLADLMASQHYGTVAAVAHEQGLTIYGEALEDRRPSLGDDMAMRSHADVPMSAMWTYSRKSGPNPDYIADIKGAASVAHIYGQNLVAAESMTSALAPWAYAPSDLRRIIDLEFVTGVNRPVVHTSVHQPTDDKLPGLSLFIFGQYFNRHETWAEMARPWVDYMARNGFLLQQGRNHADVAYFYGEEAPLTALYNAHVPADAPVRYAYDYVNADALLGRLNVDHGDLAAASGARYRVLYLGGSSSRMTLTVLRRLAALAEAGATIVGTAPIASPSLNDDRVAFAALVRRLWAGGPVTRVGAGRVIADRNVEAALASIGAVPDFAYAGGQGDSEIKFLHRRLTDADLYLLDNRKDRAEHVEARFAVTGKRPEIWRADTGTSEPVSYRIEGGQTVVPLDLGPEDSFFVLFRQPATAPSVVVTKPEWHPVAQLGGPWDVTFQAGRGAPDSARLATLASLTEQSDPGIRYFSGVATYVRDFTLPAGARQGRPLLLDLGRVGDVAEIWVNGARIGTVWHAPDRIDIGGAVKRGTNRLEIRVADLWVNRLIGDAQPGARKITWTAMPTYRPDAPLRPSGLIGPVTLLRSDGP